jgi:5-methylcytosine-specific restriction enzyme A
MPRRPAIHGATPKPKRLSASQRGYGREWQRFRESHADLVPPVCVRCDFAGKSDEMQLDHKIPVTGPDDPRFLDHSAVQWLCEACHSKKTTTEDGGFGRLNR